MVVGVRLFQSRMAPICGALDGTKTSVDSRRFKGFGAECQKEMIQFNLDL